MAQATFLAVCIMCFLAGCWIVISAWQQQDLMRLLYGLIVTLSSLVAMLIAVLVITWRR